MDATKDVVIGGNRYQVGRVSPTTGCWIANTLVMATLRSQSEDSEKEVPEEVSPEEKAKMIVESIWLVGGTTLSHKTYEDIQFHLLGVCKRYEPDGIPPTPVIANGRRWAAKELESDGKAVQTLIREALHFNLIPFFVEETVTPP